jgi:hypothetical protein
MRDAHKLCLENLNGRRHMGDSHWYNSNDSGVKNVRCEDLDGIEVVRD